MNGLLRRSSQPTSQPLLQCPQRQQLRNMRTTFNPPRPVAQSSSKPAPHCAICGSPHIRGAQHGIANARDIATFLGRSADGLAFVMPPEPLL